MSVFPNGTVFKFKTPWKWEGRSYKMTKGHLHLVHLARIRPSRRRQVRTADGAATFQITQTPAKPKPKPKKKKK